jgi:hypothetical protein
MQIQAWISTAARTRGWRWQKELFISQDCASSAVFAQGARVNDLMLHDTALVFSKRRIEWCGRAVVGAGRPFNRVQLLTFGQ